MILVTFMLPTFMIWMCRINAMTFKISSRTITIKNKKLARMLIAYKNSWGIVTSADKRNRISLAGIVSYIMFLPEMLFIMYDWWIFLSTGRAEQCFAEKIYLVITVWVLLITLSIKIVEADKFDKGKIS